MYSGTHDNNTTIGWWRKEIDEKVKARIRDYAGQEVHEVNVHLVFARLAYSSVADIAILPVQDILGLNEMARMNVPSSAADNWVWRLAPGQLNGDVEGMLREWVRIYNR